MIEVNYNDYKRILEENMRLIPENHKLKEEIERLNKIINKLEKWLKLAINRDDTEFFKGAWSDTLRKLQELKESDKE